MALAPRVDKIDRNYVINGNFDYWQRGTSSSTTGYLADRMHCVATSATSITYSRSTDVPAGVGATYSLSLAGTNAIFPRVEHRIESVYAAKLATKAITIQFKVKVVDSTGLPVQVITSYPNAVDNYTTSTVINTTDVVSTPVVGSWVTYRVNVTAPPQVTNGLRVAITRPSVSGANTTTLISQLMVIEGTFNTDIEYAYAAKNYIEELILCQRYYEKSYNLTDNPGTITSQGATVFASANPNGGGTILTTPFKVKKRAVPTATVYSPGTGALNNMRNASGGTDLLAGVNNVGEFSLGVANGATGVGGNVYSYHWTADAEIN